MLRIYICMKSVVMWLCSLQAFWFWTYIIFMKRSVSFGKQECFTAVRNHLLVFFSVPLCVVSITNVLKQTGSPLAVRKYQCVEECGHEGHTEQATHGLSFFPYLTLHGYMNHSDKADFCDVLIPTQICSIFMKVHKTNNGRDVMNDIADVSCSSSRLFAK